jgi:hypothetical protein
VQRPYLDSGEAIGCRCLDGINALARRILVPDDLDPGSTLARGARALILSGGPASVRQTKAPLPDPEAWMAHSPAAVDDEATPAAPKPDALAALRAKAFDPIWNP